MTILFFEEFPGSSSLQWVAVRAESLKNFPNQKESLVVCFKNDNKVYEYSGMDSEGDFSPRKVFDTMKIIKVSPKMGTQKSPGTYFFNIRKLLRLYKMHGKFASFKDFHIAKYGEVWKDNNKLTKADFPVRNWAGRLVGW